MNKESDCLGMPILECLEFVYEITNKEMDYFYECGEDVTDYMVALLVLDKHIEDLRDE